MIINVLTCIATDRVTIIIIAFIALDVHAKNTGRRNTGIGIQRSQLIITVQQAPSER